MATRAIPLAQSRAAAGQWIADGGTPANARKSPPPSQFSRPSPLAFRSHIVPGLPTLGPPSPPACPPLFSPPHVSFWSQGAAERFLSPHLHPSPPPQAPFRSRWT